MNIQEDLIQRKNEIEKVTAYATLRKGVSFLIKLQKIAVIIGLLIFVIMSFQHRHAGATIFQILISIGSTVITFVFLSVIEKFLNAIIDGIDLQLLANRRRELDKIENKD